MSTLQTGSKFTGWHMLAIMLAFFGTVIAVNIYFAVVAARSWTGVVVEDSYASGLDFNEKTHRAEEQAALGWRGKVDYVGGRLSFALAGADQAPVAIAAVSAHVTRPIGDREDRTVPLSPAPDGTFAAALQLGAGTWNVEVMAEQTPHGAYDLHTQLIVP